MKKAVAMPAFNILASIGIIATLFLGFYLMVGREGFQEAFKVKADIEQLDSSSQLLTILRTPIGEKTIADKLAEDSTEEFIKKLKIVFGDDIKYRISLPTKSVKSDPEPSIIIAKLDTIIPTYAGGTKKLVVEVGS